MLKQKENLQRQIQQVEQAQKQSIAQVNRLKNLIDLKINRILMLLETEPTRNATKTVRNKLVESQSPDVKKIKELLDRAGIQMSLLNQTDKITQKQENQNSEFLAETQKMGIQKGKQQGEGSQNSSQSSTNEFLSMKLSQDSSNPEIWRDQEEIQNRLNFRIQPYQSLRLRHCESKSEGGEDLDYHNRISEVPEQLEVDPDQTANQLGSLKIYSNPKIEKDTKENIQACLSQSVIAKQNNYNIIRQRSKTAYQKYLPNKNVKNYKNIRFIEDEELHESLFTKQNFKEHKSSLCSVRKLVNNLNQPGQGDQKQRKSLLSEKIQDLMKKDFEYLLKKRRRQTSSGYKLRQNLLAKFRYFMNKKETSMRF